MEYPPFKRNRKKEIEKKKKRKLEVEDGNMITFFTDVMSKYQKKRKSSDT